VAILASAIITSLRATLLDPSPGVTWTDARLLALLNEGERAICLAKPEAYTVQGALTLAAGTVQTIPAGGTAILNLYHNTAGTKRRVILVDPARLDAANPAWPNDTATSIVNFWFVDPRDPTRYHVSPPQVGSNTVAGLYGMTPTPIAAVGNNINLPDIYEQVLKCFVLAEAYAENTDRQDLAKSDYYRKEWKGLLGLRSTSQVAVSPSSDPLEQKK
jgi:hypothetical protein